MLKQLEGVVIKTQHYGETHKLITIFSKELGKITAISRGSNRPRSRLNAVSQLFVLADFLIYVSKGLSTIQQGQMNHSYRQIREDIIKTAYASYLIELLDKVTESREKDLFIYRELIDTLSWINDEDEFMIPLFMLEFKLFKKAGIAPVFSHCVRCNGVNYPFSFSIREGGLLCTRCKVHDEQAMELTNSIAKMLPLLEQLPLHQTGTITVKKETIHLLRAIFDLYYDEYGGYRLKSRQFLKQLNMFNGEI